MILASRTAPHASIVRRDSPALDWTTADRCGALHILETILPSRDGEAITIHAALLPLERLAMVPAVNSVGQNYQWQDEIVRGMCLWDDAHMLHMNTLLRRTAKQYLDDIDDTQDTIAVLNGNGNLFWNLGHFVYLKPVLYQHSREHLHGRHTALVQDSCGLRLDVVDVCALSRDVEFAVSGLRILRRGEVVDLFARDPDTGRPAVCDYYGDLTHVVHGFRLSLSLSRSLFSAASQIVDQDATIRYAKSEILNTYIQDAVCGYPISSVLAPDEDSSSVRTSLARFGYVERSLGEPLVPGTYALGDDGLLSIAYRRGTLGHSVIASTEDPGILLLVNSYTNPSRKGFTLEDTARLVTRVASSLGQRAQDALVLSSSGDVRIVLGRKNDLRCLEQNKRGETLLFKGGLEYGLSNALIITAKT